MKLHQVLKLVQVMDSRLKRVDFNDTGRLGVSFSGYYEPLGRKTISGASKMRCISVVIEMLYGESHTSNAVERAEEWLDRKLPGWRDETGWANIGCCCGHNERASGLGVCKWCVAQKRKSPI